MRNKIQRYIIFFLFFCLNQSYGQRVLFWDNFFNSQQNLKYHLFSKANPNNINKDIITNSANNFQATGGIANLANMNLKPWEQEYNFYTNPNCITVCVRRLLQKSLFLPRLLKGGGCHNQQRCTPIKYYAKQADLAYISQTIYSESGKFLIKFYNNDLQLGTFQISFQAKKQTFSELNIILLYRSDSCAIRLRSLHDGNYAESPDLANINLSSDNWQLVTTTLSYTTFCQAKNMDNQIKIGINGDAFIKEFVVIDPSSSDKLQFVTNQETELVFSKMLTDESKVVDIVNYESSTQALDMSQQGDTYKNIQTIIGTQFNDYLIANSALQVNGIGGSNKLECAINNCILNGEGNTDKNEFIIKKDESIQKVQIISFNYAQDKINLIDYISIHQIKHLNPVFESTSQVSLTLDESVEVVITFSPELQSLELIEDYFEFAEHPCLEICFECRTQENCAFCHECDECDNEGCQFCQIGISIFQYQYFQKDYYLLGKECIPDECPLGYYQDEEKRKCINCQIDYCIHCDKDLECTICESDKYLYKEICLESCLERTYSSTEINYLGNEALICIDCTKYCQKCSKIGCELCDENYIILRAMEYKCYPQQCEGQDNIQENKFGKFVTYDQECSEQSDEDQSLIEQKEEVVDLKLEESIDGEVLERLNQYKKDTIIYELAQFNLETNYFCQKEPQNKQLKCNCKGNTHQFSKFSKIGSAFAVLRMILSLIPEQNSQDTFLCNQGENLFDENCEIDPNTFNKNFLAGNLKLIQELPMIKGNKTKIGTVQYNIDNFKLAFEALKGQENRFAILRIITKNYDTHHLLLLKWKLQYNDECTLQSSFNNKEQFLVADPLAGCNVAQNGVHYLDFNYQDETEYKLQSIIILEQKQTLSKLPQILSDYTNSQCYKYIYYHQCKLSSNAESNFQKEFEKQTSVALNFISIFYWDQLTLLQQCSIIDLLFILDEGSLYSSSCKVDKYADFQKFLRNKQYPQAIESLNLDEVDEDRVSKDKALLSQTSSSYNYTASCQTRDALRESFLKSIIINENFKQAWYLDSKNNPTIGIGYELTALINQLKEADATTKNKYAKFILKDNYLINYDFDSFLNDYFNKLSLTDKMKYLNTLPQMTRKVGEQLMNEYYYPNYLQETKRFCSLEEVNIDFEKLSITRQSTLLDLIYNQGSTKLAKFNQTIENLKAGKYYESAKELLDSTYSTQVYFRALTNAMRIAIDIDFLQNDATLIQYTKMGVTDYAKQIKACASESEQRKKAVEIFENAYDNYQKAQ